MKITLDKKGRFPILRTTFLISKKVGGEATKLQVSQLRSFAHRNPGLATTKPDQDSRHTRRGQYRLLCAGTVDGLVVCIEYTAAFPCTVL